MSNLKSIPQVLVIASLLLVGSAFLILVSPLLLLIFIKGDSNTRARAFDKEYDRYLSTIDGTKFFCYNNKKSSLEFIERCILPALASDVRIIYLEGRTPKSAFDQEFISRTLYNITDRQGFPYLLKVSGSQVLDMSFSNDVHNAMRQNKDIRQLTEKMDLFFQLEENDEQ